MTAKDILHAVDQGVNFLNWCGIGHNDGMAEAIRALGSRRNNVFVAVQFFARSGTGAQEEFNAILNTLGTDYIDVLTYYYVEHEDEWNEIINPGGAAEVLEFAKARGTLRSIGITSHQRRFAAHIAESGQIDMLMVRYNAAHRGAESDVFPIAKRCGIPVVTYTALRWGALLRPTPDDPPGFKTVRAPDWYRFVLANPDVAVGVMAPQTSDELLEDIEVLTRWRGFTNDEYQRLRAHGDRVHKHAGRFP